MIPSKCPDVTCQAVVRDVDLECNHVTEIERANRLFFSKNKAYREQDIIIGTGFCDYT